MWHIFHEITFPHKTRSVFFSIMIRHIISIILERKKIFFFYVLKSLLYMCNASSLLTVINCSYLHYMTMLEPQYRRYTKSGKWARFGPVRLSCRNHPNWFASDKLGCLSKRPSEASTICVWILTNLRDFIQHKLNYIVQTRGSAFLNQLLVCSYRLILIILKFVFFHLKYHIDFLSNKLLGSSVNALKWISDMYCLWSSNPPIDVQFLPTLPSIS